MTDMEKIASSVTETEPYTSKARFRIRIPRRIVRDRANGLCERCGSELLRQDHTHHHRVLRRHGGHDSVENLLYLCIPCHRWIHRNERFALSRGWVVVPGAQWISPVWVRDEFWAILTADGTYERVSDDLARHMLKWIIKNSPPDWNLTDGL